jgi:hypothetical protein
VLESCLVFPPGGVAAGLDGIVGIRQIHRVEAQRCLPAFPPTTAPVYIDYMYYVLCELDVTLYYYVSVTISGCVTFFCVNCLT